ncbi:MAG: hypothetical protein ACLFP8_04805 [Alphaproteobacteria bacterium]
MALTNLFNTKNGSGYVRAMGAMSSPRDVMAMTGFSRPDSGNSRFFMGEEPPVNPMQALIGGYQEEKHSLMSKLHGDRVYKVDPIHTDNMKRNVGSAVKDSVEVAGQHANAVQDVREKKTAFVQDWKEAKGQAVGMLKDVAKDMGVDMAAVDQDLVGKGLPSPLGAAAALAADAMLGGGTLATIAGGATVVRELSKNEKKLPPEKQKALIEETLTRLQAGKKIDTREASSGGASEALAASEKKGGGDQPDWAALSAKDLKEFLAADPEGEDQPEMKELANVEHHLQNVSHNHQYVQDHYGDVVTADKVEAAGIKPEELKPAVVAAAPVLLAGATLGLIGRHRVSVDEKAVEELPLKPEMKPPEEFRAMLDNEMPLRFRT